MTLSLDCLLIALNFAEMYEINKFEALPTHWIQPFLHQTVCTGYISRSNNRTCTNSQRTTQTLFLQVR